MPVPRTLPQKLVLYRSYLGCLQLRLKQRWLALFSVDLVVAIDYTIALLFLQFILHQIETETG